MSRARRLNRPMTLVRRTLGPAGPRGQRREQWAHRYPMRGVVTMGSVAALGGNTEDESSRTVTDWTAIVAGHPMLPDLEDGENPARPPGAQDRIEYDGQTFVIDGMPQREGRRVGRGRRVTVFRLRGTAG